MASWTNSPWLGRVAVAVAMAGSAVLFLPNAGDPVNIGKVTLVAWCAVAAVAWAAWRAVRLRTVVLPWGAAGLAAAALAAAFCIAAVVAPQGHTAWVGAYGRNSGLLAYASGLVLFSTLLCVWERDAAWFVPASLIAAAGFTASYGLLQYAGLDPIHWNNPFNPIIAALGNPDFASGYLGICAPAVAWGALESKVHVAWRVTSAVVLVASLTAAVLSDAVQGPFAAAGGLSVLAFAWLLDTGRFSTRRLLLGFGAAAGAGLAIIGLGIAGRGPLATIFARQSFRARNWYWEAALTMWRGRPLQGVGLDQFGLYWRRARPLAASKALGGEDFSDAAHSVPLQHLAQGGLILAATYTIFVTIVAVALVKGLRELRGADRLLLGGVGGSWAAYQVQSTVSIDQVPQLVAHFVLSAGVVAAANQGAVRRFRLPGAPRTHTGRRRPAPAPIRSLSAVDVAWAVAIVALSCTLLWGATTPLRASLAFYKGEVAFSRGNGDAARAAYLRAIALESGEGTYHARLGQLYEAARANQLAIAEYRAAFAVDPARVRPARDGARLAEADGERALAERLLSAALQADPHNPSTILDFTWFELRQSHGDVARRTLISALRDFPDDARLWSALGDANVLLGDSIQARSDYEKALAIRPGEPGAVAGLAALRSRRPNTR